MAATDAAGVIGGEGAEALRLPLKLYRVSEIADHLGLTRQTIHNYATIGLIAEEGQTPGGQRLFGESVFADLALILRLKQTHRLHEIRRILDGRRPSPAPETEKGTVPLDVKGTVPLDVKGTVPFSLLRGEEPKETSGGATPEKARDSHDEHDA
jgi:DNA-binding transcriptional MerR regulator